VTLSAKNPDVEVLLLFCFSDAQPIMLKAKRSIASDGKKRGFTVKHPVTQKEIKLIFFKVRPDFKRKRIVYEFIEDLV